MLYVFSYLHFKLAKKESTTLEQLLLRFVHTSIDWKKLSENLWKSNYHIHFVCKVEANIEQKKHLFFLQINIFSHLLKLFHAKYCKNRKASRMFYISCIYTYTATAVAAILLHPTVIFVLHLVYNTFYIFVYLLVLFYFISFSFAANILS